MKVEEILKSITPEVKKREIEKIEKVKLPAELRKWVDEYEKIGERDEFIWKWIYKGDIVAMKSFDISEKYCCSILRAVFLVQMFTNLIDDISEKRKGKKLLNELLKIPFDRNCITLSRLNKEEKKYLMFTTKVWNEIERVFKKYPFYRETRSLFEYDIYQLLNTTRYSFLVYDNPYLINKTEYWMYFPHNMQFIIAFDFCLMCSKFNLKDVAEFREIILYIQKALRVGNDIGTWKREIRNNDFTNGICVHLIDSEIFTVDELKRKSKTRIIKKIENFNVEREVLKEWEKSCLKIREINKKNSTVNVKKFLYALEKITFYHLLSKEYL